jgi:hypothetical protein
LSGLKKLLVYLSSVVVAVTQAEGFMLVTTNIQRLGREEL